MNFDPNTQAPPFTPEWATYVQGRRPKFKIHKSLGHAKNAFTYDRYRTGTLYRFEDGEWKEKARIERPVTQDSVCSQCGDKPFWLRRRWIGFELKTICSKCVK